MLKRNYNIVRKSKDGLEPTMVPTKLDIAWAAGIYEGEGSCNTPDDRSNAFAVQVTQKDPEFLYRLRDLFGGSVKPYMNGGFSINHWRTSGDKAKVFLAAIYPYLTSRRREQIESTGAKKFLNEVSHLMYVDKSQEPCGTYVSFWNWLEERAVESRKKAKAYKVLRENGYYAERSKNDPAWMEKRRLATAKWRAGNKQKEQLLNVVEMKKTA